MEKRIYVNYNPEIDKIMLIEDKNKNWHNEFHKSLTFLKVSKNIYNFKLLLTLIAILTILMICNLFFNTYNLFFNIIIFIQYIIALAYLYYSIFKVNL